VGSRSKVKILRVLFRFPDSEFTGEDLARKASVSKPIAHSSLSQLVEENVVARRVAGRAYLYRLLSDSYSTRLVERLFRDQDSPLEELARLVKKKLGSARVVSVILYGSVARSGEGPASDIDLYVIVGREADRRQVELLVSKLNRLIISRFGNRLSAMIQTAEESRVAYQRRRGLELQVESQGRVLLGVNIREALE
jgi:predicted nucleotidyltransferase